MGFAEFLGPIAQIGTALLNKKSVQDTNATNMAIAKEANAQTKEMSDTAHQRQVEDMKKAGLNPRLSAGGSGASSPGMQTATMQAPTIADPSPAINSAVSAKLAREQFDQAKIMQEQQLALNAEEIKLKKLKQETELNTATNIQEDTFNKVQNNKMLELQYGDKSSQREADLRYDLYNAYANDRAKELIYNNAQRDVDYEGLKSEREAHGFEYQKNRFRNKHGDVMVPLNEITSQVGNILSVGTSAKSLMMRKSRETLKRESYNGMGEHTGTTYTTRGK